MAPGAGSSLGGVGRRAFRWLRVLLLCLALLGLIMAIWLQQVGLPESVKRALLAELRSRGLEVEFTRLRLDWFRGIIAENLTFGRAATSGQPRLFAREGELQINRRALRRGEVHVAGIILSGGRLELEVPLTNTVSRLPPIEKIWGELRFGPGDQWQLRSFQAEALGLKLVLSGTITNGSALRRSSGRPTTPPDAAWWNQFARQLQRIEFTGGAEVMGSLNGDARDPESFRLEFAVRAPECRVEQIRGKDLYLVSKSAPGPGHPTQLRLTLSHLDAPWGQVDAIQADMVLEEVTLAEIPSQFQLRAQARRVQHLQGSLSDLRLFSENSTNSDGGIWVRTSAGAAQAQCRDWRIEEPRAVLRTRHGNRAWWPELASSEWAAAQVTNALGRMIGIAFFLTNPVPPRALADRDMTQETDRRWWNRWPGEFAVEVEEIDSPRLSATNLTLAGSWQTPQLRLHTLGADLYGGGIRSGIDLDVDSRALRWTLESDCDPHGLYPLMTRFTSNFLSQFSWQLPPKVAAAGQLTLPAAITNGLPWKRALVPSLVLTGAFTIGHGGFRGVPVESGRSHFVFSNQWWQLPVLEVLRPEGPLYLKYSCDTRSNDFTWEIDSQIQVSALRGVLETESQRRWLDDFRFTSPPVVQGRLSGRWHFPERIHFDLAARATNCFFREQAIAYAETGLVFSNRTLIFHDGRLERSEGDAYAPWIEIDFDHDRARFVDVTSRVSVAAVAATFGTNAVPRMAPYVFARPPQVRLNGILCWEDPAGTDLTFDVNGGPFRWKAFALDEVAGTVRWEGRQLKLRRAAGPFHGGTLQGDATFDFAAPVGTDFEGSLQLKGVDLHRLMTDLSRRTNKLEGVFAGVLVFTNGNTARPATWEGFGRIDLQDGLLWEFPVFGVFSPILNKVMPGLGNSRVTTAQATFAIQNAGVQSRDLELRASGMRMQYRGRVGFDGSVDGAVEAELFRDMPALGFIVSKLLWPVTKLFEYKVTGTLREPVTEPLYIPKILMAPFHPLRTLMELMPEERVEPGAGAPE